MSPGFALLVCAAYIALLFVIAFVSDRRARLAGFRAPLPAWMFTLSISVYCTSWTFYGSVGLASRSGLEFTAIYLGPTLVFLGWWFCLRKIVRLTKQQRLTSIADFISARFGKSGPIAMLITVMALLASTPYIALQLKAVAQTYDLLADRTPGSPALWADSGFWVAAAMTLFALMFGTRRGSADEHYPGVISAIAFEAIVKLLALGTVGLFIVSKLWTHDGSLEIDPEILSQITSLPADRGGRWITLLLLSAIAIVCLPRQFQVTAVEAVDERHFRTAAWLFPLYLFFMSLFVIPIALAGFVFLTDEGLANPDLFVMTIPLAFDNAPMALLAFIGGFSSATSMVIVSAIALSIMISNHLIVPLLLPRGQSAPDGTERGQFQSRLLTSRRIAIAFVLTLAFLYYRLAGTSDALAAMGLIAFVGVAQFAPALLAALFWRRAKARAVFCALLIGFGLWAYCLALPALFSGAAWVSQGPWGLRLLAPQSLLGAQGLDPVVHATLWSLSLNAAALILLSLSGARSPLERLQERVFVDVFSPATPALAGRVWQRSTAVSDLTTLAQNVLGAQRASQILSPLTSAPGGQATSALIGEVEQELAAHVGAASAHHLVARITKGESLSVEDMSLILGKTQEALDQARALEVKSQELEETAKTLRQALVQVRRLDRFKDTFLSQVSHELRTPMTSLKAFNQILAEDAKTSNLTKQTRDEYLGIMGQEISRLTDLLDELLDIRKSTALIRDKDSQAFALQTAITNAQRPFRVAIDQGKLIIVQTGAAAQVRCSPKRLTQVFINLFSNALKYANTDPVQVYLHTQIVHKDKAGDRVVIDVDDNGPGFPLHQGQSPFEAYSRAATPRPQGRQGEQRTQGTGLGLAICKQIMLSMEGEIELVAQADRSKLRLTLPAAEKDLEKEGAKGPADTNGQLK